MSEKLTKEGIKAVADVWEKLLERASTVTCYLGLYGEKHHRALSVEKIFEVTEDIIWVEGVDKWGDDCSVTFPVKYMYDDEALDGMKGEYEERERLRKEKEEEDKKYYAKLKEEDEKRELKRLQKKYPDVK